MLGVLPSKLAKGCSSLQGEENLQHFANTCQDVMSLEAMLSTQFRTDAHFTTYAITDYPMWPRLNKSIVPEIRQEGLDVVFNYFAFDWDNPDHAVWTNESLIAFANKIDTCTDPVLSAWTAIYTTKHGARLIYQLNKPVPVDMGEQNLAWVLHRFEEGGFTQIDGSCKDFTRLFRCPQVLRDGEPTWEQSYFSMLPRLDVRLDMSLVGKRSPATIAKKTYFVKNDEAERPTFEMLASLLHAVNKETGKGTTQTEFYKRAKRALKDSQYCDLLFHDAAPDWMVGQRNNQIMLLLGTITPLLLKQAHASISQVFALVVNPLLTLPLDNGQAPDHWVQHGWNALLDIYEREVNKYNIEKEEKAQQISKEIDLLDMMREGMKSWNSHPTLLGDDDEAARGYVKRNVICSADGYFFLMGKDGFYEPFAVGKDQLISRIRQTHLSGIIETSRMGFNGEYSDVSAISLQNDYSTPVSEVLMKPVGDRGGFIEDMNGLKPSLVLSTFCRNDALEPTHNQFVEEWLINLFGSEYEKGCAWIGNSLAFDEGLICAMSLEGASASGKKLLTVGLSECLKGCPFPAGPADVYGQSSAFLRTPFLAINESWPSGGKGKSSPADVFKSLTGGDGIRVDEKYRPSMTILCPVRVILTANDDGIIKELIRGKDMTLDNRIAIGERLFHVKVTRRAALFLESIGGRDFTAKPGQRWIRPDSGNEQSDFAVAKHFLWLYKNRPKVNASKRFLVMGNSSPGSNGDSMVVFEKLLADNNSTPLVAQAILEILDRKVASFQKYIKTNTEMTRLWVTRHGIHKYIKEILEEKRIEESDVYSGMQNLMAGTEPDLYDGLHWFEMNIEMLNRIATERGIAQSYIRNMMINKMAAMETVQ